MFWSTVVSYGVIFSLCFRQQWSVSFVVLYFYGIGIRSLLFIAPAILLKMLYRSICLIENGAHKFFVRVQLTRCACSMVPYAI
ncbi:hypothetical protein BDV24DRAFT_67222 [Aspergillus arachidicola]|uniref:Uncharacterized protein n=1 Tax=Aspergillus arachidicola TaxID=656916 RepID=A0A5N6YQ14_9EURO|nr:hypothetical protein BDV24DRAFT_67222 [Aspergillus arachidicola]